MSDDSDVARSAIINESNFKDTQVDAILGTAARLLLRENHEKAAHLLANSGGHIRWQEFNRGGGGREFTTYRFWLKVPADVFFDLDDRETIEEQINSALRTATQTLDDLLEVQITTLLDEDPDWRAKVNRHLQGDGINNQGRVRSDNVATLQYDGLLFRSTPEALFYQALRTSGVPFAPLSVVLNGGMPTRKRVEPDFLLYKEGQTMIVEIDGDLYHRETPAEAHARLKFLTDEGLKLERINADECNTPPKAIEAVKRVLRTFEKHRLAR
jgi:hypothetical protein